MAFTLYDGLATWDLAGKTSVRKTTISSGTVTSASELLGGVSFAAPGANCNDQPSQRRLYLHRAPIWTGTVTPSLSGDNFTPVSTSYTTPVQDNQANQNYSATSAVLPGATVWGEDMVPAGATVAGHYEGWHWITNNPSPISGGKAHQSALVSGMHQHYFFNASNTLTPGIGDTLFAYIYLDPANPPSEIMLQWNDGSWEHRAYWGPIISTGAATTR